LNIFWHRTVVALVLILTATTAPAQSNSRKCELARSAAMLAPTQSGSFAESMANGEAAYARCMSGDGASGGSGGVRFLMGGRNHDVYLGCLGCSPTDQNSICSPYGMGSALNANSIFNTFGDFGDSFSKYSPWNKYQSKFAPVLVDRSGNFYGYFTIDTFNPKAFEAAARLAKIHGSANGDLNTVQGFICN
jgi:hypothetical protein